MNRHREASYSRGARVVCERNCAGRRIGSWDMLLFLRPFEEKATRPQRPERQAIHGRTQRPGTIRPFITSRHREAFPDRGTPWRSSNYRCCRCARPYKRRSFESHRKWAVMPSTTQTRYPHLRLLYSCHTSSSRASFSFKFGSVNISTIRSQLSLRNLLSCGNHCMFEGSPVMASTITAIGYPPPRASCTLFTAPSQHSSPSCVKPS